MKPVCWMDSKTQESVKEICGRSVPDLLRIRQELMRRQQATLAVDGEIIGTGESDFTKGNFAYEFSCSGKTFHLVDMPGIEGDESRFERCIQQAVAKAHLVFYVNGTNKKPEIETAKKIKKYLNRYAQVLPICNMRGKADSYEFKEDRINLGLTHKGAKKALTQTEEVLREALGKEYLLQGVSIQGLLGFCSLAYTPTRQSSISPSRSQDLLKDQISYAKFFLDPEEMRKFSQIDQLKHFLEKRKDRFREDLVESNKRKILYLLDKTLHSLITCLEKHESIAQDVKQEIDVCKESVSARFNEHSVKFKKLRKMACDSFFTAIETHILELVKKKIDNKIAFESETKRIVDKEKSLFQKRLRGVDEKQMSQFVQDVEAAVERLYEDIKRVHFEHELTSVVMKGLSVNSALDEMKLSKKDLGGGIFTVAGYTLSGTMLGSAFPGLGNIIGAVIGFVTGVISAVVNVFIGKEKKIRNAQKKVSKKIDEVRRTSLIEINAESMTILKQVDVQIKNSIFKSLDEECMKMGEVSALIHKQIKMLEQYKMTIGEYEYGYIE